VLEISESIREVPKEWFHSQFLLCSHIQFAGSQQRLPLNEMGRVSCSFRKYEVYWISLRSCFLPLTVDMIEMM